MLTCGAKAAFGEKENCNRKKAEQRQWLAGLCARREKILRLSLRSLYGLSGPAAQKIEAHLILSLFYLFFPFSRSS
jgi:hypothetical protein